MKTPDLTPAQVIAALSALVPALVVVFKLNLTDAQTAGILGIIGTLVPVAWFVADAIIRHGRANVVAAQVIAGVDTQPKPVVPPPPPAV